MMRLEDYIKDKLSFTNWCQSRADATYTWVPWFSVIFFAAFYFLVVNLYHYAVVIHHGTPPAHISLIYIAFTIILVGAYASLALFAQYDGVQSLYSIKRSRWWIEVVIAVIGVYLASVVINVVFKLTFNVSVAGVNQLAIDQFTHAHGLVLLWFVLMLIIIAPVGEEVFFRFMLIGPSNFEQSQMNKIGRWIRIIASGALFIYMHAGPQIDITNWGSVSSVAGTVEVVLRYVVITAALTYLYIHNNDLRSSISAHIGINTLSCLFMFARELFI